MNTASPIDFSSLRRFVGPVAFALALGALVGCTEVPTYTEDVVANPRAVALVCIEDGKPRLMKDCPSVAQVRAFVTSGSEGSIAIAVPSEKRWIDTDAAIPGYTPLMLGGLPQAIVADPLDPRYLYVTLGVEKVLPGQSVLTHAVARIDVVTLDVRYAALSFAPAGLIVAASTLFVADPQGGRVWALELGIFDDKAGTPAPIEVGGSPHSLALAPKLGEIWVGHLRHNQVSVLDASARTVVARPSLGPACDDGLDNDGDGLIDSLDPGCDDRLDDHEGDAELGPARCGDGKDNDGDGLIDALDPSCAVTSTTDLCRDGVDNDGDGKTDYPDDPGCVGFGGLSESRGAPTCGDGVDNDGDGQTDVADMDCADLSADTELPAPKSDVYAACGDGVDNDGDGKTDLQDSDCPTAASGAEQRPACDDGLDNDGDGKTDNDDPDCFNRASSAEVSSDRAPVSVLTVSPSGEYVLVSHRQRQMLYVFDAKTHTLLVPVLGQSTSFLRPSAMELREGKRGLSLEQPPLAMAPLSVGGRDGAALTLALGGLVQVQVRDATGALAIGLVGPETPGESKSDKPTLEVEGKYVDLGSNPPRRYASFGSLIKGQSSAGTTSWYGLTLSEEEVEHRSERWRFVFEGLLPGGRRHSGQLVASDRLVDSHANFCRLGVVPGDLLLLNRGPGAKDCEGLQGETLRYKVLEVSPDSLRLDPSGGVVDTVLDATTQLTAGTSEGASAPAAIPLPSARCLPRTGLSYELRADGWLVLGERSGLLSSRPRVGAACEPWTPSAVATASRLVEPELHEVGGAPVTLSACPLTEADVDAALRVKTYGSDDLSVVKPFVNPVFSGRLLPGCLQPDTAGAKPRLLPSIRDMTWTFPITSGFLPLSTGVGVSPVALSTISALDRAYVVDQGVGALYVVGIANRVIEEFLQ